MPFVASGTYGCIFKPNVTCPSSAKCKSGTVGKLFADSKEADIEKRIHESVVHKVDPDGVFTVKLLDICEVRDERRSEEDSEDDLDSCPLIDREAGGIEPTVYKQIIYSYGGVSLDSYMKNESPSWTKFKKTLKALGPIFEGVSKLNAMGWVHQDIKPGNILIHSDGAFLIDFGLLTEARKIYAESNNFVLNYPYPYYPPEFKLKAAEGSLARFRTLVAENLITLENVRRRLVEFGVDFEGDVASTFESRVKDPMKVDSYSLGIVLASLYNWFLGGSSSASNSNSKKKAKFMDVFVLLLRAICCQDAAKRANSVEAAELYKELLLVL